ncbi:protein of unknown function [Cupriavidus taiwanensis]|uniref:Uncharacterized protein n=1 Tax=Cupriavidus taiwanensis TaxID=164546 RepID=A0A7Z7JAU7_9BURK|nr:hypothetical protein CBM2585_A90067 [Cupriavidus taiwanensis]SOY85456.1 protein of unknown function [Cupriavidus taiwanensis]SOZ03907.1 hypothetical protein CBM2597_A50083 [Cupriavidus taiwanensis]SOZ04489.1 hypothetical protein CBM2595_A50072 [Cupriavidus taiwanensis]SPC09873.1 hypothetical protein CBM2594_A41187 [Cupriavidus taiwanensis]
MSRDSNSRMNVLCCAGHAGWRRARPRVAAVTGGVNPCPDLPLSRAPQRLPALGRNKHTQNSTVVQF